ncbi:MAG: hypothetical protein FWH49_04940 [Clostridiales bacterium]|nr:hypothetical protein [Clostridiales bacterium]
MESSIQDIIYPDNQRIVDRIKEEISSAFGSDTWDEFICDGCPDGNMDDHSLCAATQKMLEKIDEIENKHRVQEAFANVKHALKHSDFTWARERFLQYNDIDLFAEAVLHDSINFCADATKRVSLFMVSLLQNNLMLLASGHFVLK